MWNHASFSLCCHARLTLCLAWFLLHRRKRQASPTGQYTDDDLSDQVKKSIIYDTSKDQPVKFGEKPEQATHGDIKLSSGNGVWLESTGDDLSYTDPRYQNTSGNMSEVRWQCLRPIVTSASYKLCYGYTANKRQTLLDNCELDSLVSSLQIACRTCCCGLWTFWPFLTSGCRPTFCMWTVRYQGPVDFPTCNIFAVGTIVSRL